MRRIEITDMCTQPYITTCAPYMWNMSAAQRDDGLWQYTVADPTNYVRGTVGGLLRSTPPAEGDVIVLVHECPAPALLVGLSAGGSYCMRGCDWIRGGSVSDTLGWNACRVTDTDFDNHEFIIHVDATPVTLLAQAVYTADDWPHIEQQIIAGKLPAGWFAPPLDTLAGIKTSPQLIP